MNPDLGDLHGGPQGQTGERFAGWSEVQEDLIEEAGRLMNRHGITGDPRDTLLRIRNAFGAE
jgi:hypothetical protein